MIRRKNLGFSLLSLVFAITLIGVFASISMQRYLAVADKMNTLSKTQQFVESGLDESHQNNTTPQARLEQLKHHLGEDFSDQHTKVIERDGELFLQISLGRSQH